MSFSQSVKEEIFKNIKKLKGCCATSFLTAVLKSIGSLCVDHGGCRFSVDSDNGELLYLCEKLASERFGTESEFLQITTEGSSAKYSVRFDESLGEQLQLTYRDADGAIHLGGVPALNLSSACCRRAFMQALFLSCGSVTIPVADSDTFESAHSNYHLELRFSNEDFANYVLNEYSEIDFKQIKRKSSTVLYLKDSKKIADFVVFVDAVNARFAMENLLIGRSFRNDANRQRNCIDSNIEKAVLAGAKQIAAIKKLRESGEFSALPQNLKDVALAREQNPEANLAELAAVLNMSKSGVNHRLAKLLELSEGIK